MLEEFQVNEPGERNLRTKLDTTRYYVPPNVKKQEVQHINFEVNVTIKSKSN